MVFHAAAYKHVPVLERNVISGVENNVLGTKNVLDASIAAGVKTFTLISTDKAVRPTNVMGASKRLCEAMCLSRHGPDMEMKMQVVRFGNVLGSSGSVLPLFLEQIGRGGPITVTHKDVERFFMSISEAASLVVSATTLNNQSGLYVLDMGAPIKILAFAEKLIKLHGYQPYIEGSDQKGNMAIQISGLRPGEKLYEELSMSNDLIQTPSPKIFESREPTPASTEVDQILGAITKYINSNNDSAIRECLVESFIQLSGNDG